MTAGPGAGAISDGISILLPPLRADVYPYTYGPGLRDETENARETRETCCDDADFDVDPESIVAWGQRCPSSTGSTSRRASVVHRTVPMATRLRCRSAPHPVAVQRATGLYRKPVSGARTFQSSVS